MYLEKNNDSYTNDCHELVATELAVSEGKKEDEEERGAKQRMADNVHAVQRDKDW